MLKIAFVQRDDGGSNDLGELFELVCIEHGSDTAPHAQIANDRY